MLKKLEQIIDLSELYLQHHHGYYSKLDKLKNDISMAFADPRLSAFNITATDSGELKIEPMTLKVSRDGSLAIESITIDAESILVIAEILKKGLL